MSKNTMMTKIIATAMSVLLVLFTGYGLSNTRVFANAEEMTSEAVQALESPDGAQLDVALDDSVNEDPERPSDDGDEDPSPAPTAPSTSLAMTVSGNQVEPGGTVTLKLSCPEIEKDSAGNELDSLSMSMTKLPAALTVTGVKVLAGANVIYEEGRASGNIGDWDEDTNTYSFDSSYLAVSGDMSYGNTAYSLELEVSVPDTKDALSPYKDADTGNAVISLTSIEGAMKGEYVGTSSLDVTAPAFASDSSVTVLMPKLSAIMTMDPSQVQVYGTVRYNVTVTSANAAAKQIVIHDVETDALAQLGIVPTGNPSLSINGTAVELPEGAMTVSNGNIVITLPQSITIPTSQSLVVSYSMKIGADDLKEQGKLSELLALDTANRTRKVTVSAANAFDDVEVEAAFSLLVPSVSSTITSSEGESPELSTGGKVQITSKFEVLGDNGAKLVNPTINVSMPTFGSIDNIKVNGVTYSRGDALPTTDASGNPIGIYILTYDVAAPTDYEPEYNAQGIAAAATLKADNLVNNLTSSVTVKLAIPADSIAVEAQSTTPSASSEGAVNDGAVHVKTTLSEITGVASLDGYQLSISESLPATEGEAIDPAAARFQNIKVNGEAANLADYSISGTTMTFNAANLAASTSIVVEYDDYMKSGYEQNGASCNVTANVQAAAGATNSNFPANQAKTATTDYTVQTPLLHISQEVTGPVTEVPADSSAATDAGNQAKQVQQTKQTRDGENDNSDNSGNNGNESGNGNESSGNDGDDSSQGDNPLNPDNPDAPNLPTVSLVPDIVNVGDTVTYKTVFYEDNPDMPTAIGRNFKLVTSIDDLVITPASATDKNEATEENKDSADKQDTDKKDDTENTAAESDSSKRTYKASQLGITFGAVSDVKLSSGDNDVTEMFDIELSSDKTQLTITAKEGASQDCPAVPTAAEFSVKMGAAEDQNNFDQLAGNDITVRSTLSVSNLEKSVSAVSTTVIADAKVSLTMAVSNTEIGHGMTNTYTITAVNDKENKFSDSSKARNVHIENGLDDSAKAFGYRIDPSTFTVMLAGKDITSTSDVTVQWSEDNTGFDMKLSRDLPKEQDLVVTYAATTDGIDAQAYSETLGDVAIATADNSKPAVAYANILYTGADFQEGYDNGSGAGADGTIGAMGDIVLYVVGGVAVLAIIGLVVFMIWRRR